MRIQEITIKNFRCFNDKTIGFDKPFVIIEGPNGIGKTSLLEALYYSCYLRSFRTRTTRDLIFHGSEAFSIKITYQGPDQIRNKLSVGYSPIKRSVKLNNTELTAYKDLIGSYRIIAITDEDLALIKGSPEGRRYFMDQAIILEYPDYRSLLKKFGSILEQRNALLRSRRFSQDSYTLWTDQLNEMSKQLRTHRQSVLKRTEHKVNELLTTFFGSPFTVTLTYKEKNEPHQTIEETRQHEQLVKHTLFGAHLDDCKIFIADRASKKYASRGQQKLTAMLLKIAQPAALDPQSYVFLLDDAISDLDATRLKNLFAALASYKTQIIITSPLTHQLLHEICASYDYQRIQLEAPNQSKSQRKAPFNQAPKPISS